MSTVSIVISFLGFVSSAAFAYISYRRILKKDMSGAGEHRGVIISDIGYIKAGIDDLKRENKDTASKLASLTERITRCEESSKQAHHRIDEIKEN